MYLHGSLATGDFNLDTSDIDFLVVLDKGLSDMKIQELREMHGRIIKHESKWSRKLEGSFVPKDLLKNKQPPSDPRPCFHELEFALYPYGYEWVLERYVVWKHGIVVFGSSPTTFIDPIFSEDLHRANTKILRGDWKPLLTTPSRLDGNDEYQAYAVLTMCRSLFLSTHNEMGSKKMAGEWVRVEYSQWEEIVDTALRWRAGDPFGRLEEVKEMIRFTIECHRVYNET